MPWTKQIPMSLDHVTWVIVRGTFFRIFLKILFLKFRSRRTRIADCQTRKPLISDPSLTRHNSLPTLNFIKRISKNLNSFSSCSTTTAPRQQSRINCVHRSGAQILASINQKPALDFNLTQPRRRYLRAMQSIPTMPHRLSS